MKKKKKILTLIPSLYGGGAQKYAADLSSALSLEFDHVFVVYNKSEYKYDFKGRIIEIDLPEKSNWIAKVVRQFKILKRIKEIKKTENPTITISHLLIPNVLNILSKNNDKVFCFIHGKWSVKSGHSKLADYFVKRMYRKADIVISVSHYIKNMFDTYYKLNVRHEVIYVGVAINDIIQKSEVTISTRLPNKYLVYVAGFRPVKNHIKLIEHLEVYLKEQDITLVLVGDGPLRPSIENCLREKKLENKVFLLGNVSNPYPVIKRALLSIMVSSSESFSLVVVESMALGIPVISTDCGGPREIIKPNRENELALPYTNNFGVLIPKPDAWTSSSLVEQIDRLLDDSILRARISENGNDRAREFDISHSVKQYQTLIDTILIG